MERRKGGFRPFFGSAALVTALALSAVAASAATFVPGYLSYEYYPGSNRVDVETVVLAGTQAPSTGGTTVGSDKGGIIPSAEAGTNFADNYANRIFGYFIPPTTGDYVFFIAADDDSDLYLSTDADPANKKLIAQEAGWSGVRNYTLVGGTSKASDKRSDTFATSEWDDGTPGDGHNTIHLTAGTKYYIEAVHHEGGGGDNLAVTYKLASEPTPANGAPSRLSGAVIGTDAATAPTAGTVTITTQPAGATLNAGDPATTLTVAATTTSPYAIGYQWFKNGTAIAGATGKSYTIAGPVVAAQGGTYTVQAYVPNADGTMNTVTSNPATVTINAVATTLQTGFLKYEYFPGKNRGQVENGTAGAPQSPGNTVGSDKSGAVSILESGTNFADSYANRFSGYFIPPTTDDYIFLVASDDDGDLFLSTDDSPANKLLIAQETGWSGVRKYATQGGGSGVEYKSSDTCPTSQWADANNDPADGTTIHLVAGQKYYIEYVHAEGGGGDNVAVTYRTAAEDPALVADDTAPRLTGNVIATDVAAQTITITNQPANATGFVGVPVVFSVGASNSGFYPITYQWKRNGVDIPGATGSSYSLVPTAADTGAKFSVALTYFGNTTPIVSNEATLTVNPESQSLTINGALKREVFKNASRQDLENGSVGKPNLVQALTSFETPTNDDSNYSDRVSGWFTPDTTGDYVFFLAADDDTDLFLSTDATAANKQMIAQESGWSGVRRWYTVGGGSTASQKRSDTFSPDGGATTPFSAGIHLVQGTKYYIESDRHQGGGGANLAVTFKLVGGADPVEADNTDPANPIVGDPSLLTGNLISYETKPVTTTTVATQPQSISTYEAQSASFSVAVNTDSELSPTYQWRKNGTPIPGATSSSYNIGFLALGDSGQYDVVITTPNLAGTVTSSAATLNVLPAPLIRGLLKYDYFAGQTRQTVEAGTAGNPTSGGNVVGGDKSGYITIAESDQGFADNYANRISGFFIPPTTDDYVFFVNGDDDVDLFLSTDDTPANKKLIAQEGSWSDNRHWNTPGGPNSSAANKRSDTFTPSQWPDANNDPADGTQIHLTAGQVYYIEGVHHEGTGGDNFGITYKLASEADPVDTGPYDASRLKGNVIGVKVIPTVGTTPPTVTSAVATTNGVVLTLSAPIDPATLVKGNFNLGAGVTVDSISSKEVLEGSKVVSLVTLNTTGLAAGQTYHVIVNNVKDTKGNTIAANTDVAVTTPTLTLTFNDLSLPAGVTSGNNGVGNAGTIVDGTGPDGSASFFLTEAANGEQGALIIQNPVTDPVSTFTATFKLFIGHGTGNPADGMSFNFGNIDPTLTSVGEEGVGTISVDFDTYNNGNTGPNGLREAPAFEVKLNQAIVGWAPLPQAAIVNDEWVDVVISLNSDNSISTVYNGVTYFNHLSLNNPKDLVSGATVGSYTPVTGGEFMIGGRTGNENTQQSLDDLTLSINTGGTPPPPNGPTITVSQNGANLTISWAPTAAGNVLEGTPALGPNQQWTTVSTTSPATVPIGSGNMFFRVRVP